jgi:hypothetical protein
MRAAEVNERFNEYVADRRLPLCLFHDHFIGTLGGVAIFFVATPAERDALHASNILEGWKVEVHPLIYSHSPAAFDEQIAFTLRAYRSTDWEQLQREQRPRYGNPSDEANSGREAG